MLGNRRLEEVLADFKTNYNIVDFTAHLCPSSPAVVVGTRSMCRRFL